jgi:hypothetical protein
MAVSPLAALDLPLRYLARMTPDRPKSPVTLPAGWQPGIIRTRAWLASTTHRRPDRPQRSRSPGFPPKPRALIS